MTDTYGNLLHALDRAAEEMAGRDRMMERLHEVAADVAQAACRWNPCDSSRAANLIIESVWDEILDADAWCFLKACVDLEFADPKSIVRAQLEASVEELSK